VKLVEVPTQRETNDNIVAYWIPATSPTPERPFEFAYKIYFQNNEPLGASLARVTGTRIGQGEKEELRRIIVDFEGGKIKSLPEYAPLKAMISVGQDGQLVQQSLFKNRVTGGWRLAFQVKPPQGKPLELRASLQNERETLTETWSYQLAP
jgi:glucans biosynthesis protein